MTDSAPTASMRRRTSWMPCSSGCPRSAVKHTSEQPASSRRRVTVRESSLPETQMPRVWP
ncbi:MAG: hypothetical protein U0168_21580 [Nannocystaceae bacterium]